MIVTQNNYTKRIHGKCSKCQRQKQRQRTIRKKTQNSSHHRNDFYIMGCFDELRFCSGCRLLLFPLPFFSLSLASLCYLHLTVFSYFHFATLFFSPSFPFLIYYFETLSAMASGGELEASFFSAFTYLCLHCTLRRFMRMTSPWWHGEKNFLFLLNSVNNHQRAIFPCHLSLCHITIVPQFFMSFSSSSSVVYIFVNSSTEKNAPNTDE